MKHPDYNTVLISENYFMNNPEFAMEVVKNFNHAKEMNASWYGPKISFLISKPKLLNNAHTAKKSLKMKDTFNLLSLFEIIGNDDLKRFEFNSQTNVLTSYTVGYNECDNITDAKIAVYKAIKKDLAAKHQSISDLIQKLADSGIA